MTKKKRKLNPRQRRFIKAYIGGMSKQTRQELLKDQGKLNLIENIRREALWLTGIIGKPQVG